MPSKKNRACTTGRCATERALSAVERKLYAEGKKVRTLLRRKLRKVSLAWTNSGVTTEADDVLIDAADMILAPPPSPTNICAPLWARMMLAIAAYESCIAGQIEV